MTAVGSAMRRGVSPYFRAASTAYATELPSAADFGMRGVLHPMTSRRAASSLAALLAAASALVAATGSLPADAKGKGCPDGMVSVRGAFCIDAFEASTVELLPGGKTRGHSPFLP